MADLEVFAPTAVGGSAMFGADELFEIVRALAYVDTSASRSSTH